VQLPEEATSREPQYRLESGEYAFYLGDSRRFATASVSVLLDITSGVLLKHGLATVVNETFEAMTAGLRRAGYTDFASDLVVLEGRFDLEELNRLVTTSSYVSQFYENWKAAHPELAA
jgi:hypothetical protein